MLLVIDNYDSFTFNLVQYLRQLKQTVEVYPNDKISVTEVVAREPTHLVISPGPGGPKQAGISLELVQSLAGKLPILGVCLGHQVIAEAFGANVVQAGEIRHGKTSPIFHSKHGLFAKINNPFTATRYHSLLVDPISLPKCFKVTAWTQTAGGKVNEIMAIQHRQQPLYGVQFHPESILTESGLELLQRFCEI